MKLIDLTQMKPGESGIIEEIRGGHGLVTRIQGMGLRPGKCVIKVSNHFWRGPQTVAVGRLHIAIGFGMAKKIFIRIEK